MPPFFLLADVVLIIMSLSSVSPVIVTERVEPESAQFEFRSMLDVPCVETTESTRDELVSAVERQAELLTSELSCLRAGTCSLDTPRLTGCRPHAHAHNDRKRRRRAAPPGIHLLVTMTYRLRHLDFVNYHFTGMS